MLDLNILPCLAKWTSISAVADPVVSNIVDVFAQKLNATVYERIWNSASAASQAMNQYQRRQCP